MNEPDYGRRDFSRDYHKGTRFRDLIEQNSVTLQKLHADIHQSFASRGQGRDAWQAWERACAEMHDKYDALAFPGG